MVWLRRSSILLILIVSVAFNAGVATTFGVKTYRQYCERGEREKDEKDRECRQGLFETLNLNPEQSAQLNESREKLFEELRGMRRQLRDEGETLTEMMVAPEPDRAAIQTQLEQMESLRRQLQQRVVEHFLDVRSLLAPEQIEAYNDVIRNRVFSRERHGGPGPHKPLHRGGGPKRDRPDRLPREFRE